MDVSAMLAQALGRPLGPQEAEVVRYLPASGMAKLNSDLCQCIRSCEGCLPTKSALFLWITSQDQYLSRWSYDICCVPGKLDGVSLLS